MFVKHVLALPVHPKLCASGCSSSFGSGLRRVMGKTDGREIHMLIAGLAIGVATGSIAMIVSLVLGASFLNAVALYALSGLIGMCAVLIWTLVPYRKLLRSSGRPASNMSASWQSAPIVETRNSHRSGAYRHTSPKNSLTGRSAHRQNQA